MTRCRAWTTARPGEAADVNDADVMFASMMIVHHEQAIEMSDIVLAKDGVPPRSGRVG